MMEIKKRIYFVHGWGDDPEGVCWLPWLREECDRRKIELIALKMPNSNEPKIEEWVGFLEKNIKELNEGTFLLGHSIGCQTILRYLERLHKDVRIGGCIFVAGWFDLLETAYEEEGEKEIAKPWLESQIDFNKIKNHTNRFIGIFSDNDECVPLSDAKIFKEKLNAEIIIKNREGHFDDTKEIGEIIEFVK